LVMARTGHNVHKARDLGLHLSRNVPRLGARLSADPGVACNLRENLFTTGDTEGHRDERNRGKRERKIKLTQAKDLIRCGWARNELSILYHDREWGVPVHDDRTLFEFLILEGAQAGLSWDTILNKRENYRAAFDDFDPEIIARYDKPR
jgi:hypothetical protein